MIPVQKLNTESLVTAAFMAMGFQQQSTEAIHQALDAWSGGEYELIEQMVAYTMYHDALQEAGCTAIEGTYGIYQYEVAENFGAWFLQAMQVMTKPTTLPSHESCKKELLKLALNFFTKNDDLDPAPIRLALEAVEFEWPPEFISDFYDRLGD